jgi:hypothetical protein
MKIFMQMAHKLREERRRSKREVAAAREANGGDKK